MGLPNHSIRFFDNQFKRQVREADFALNPFERLALPFVGGRLLDLGCGLGNLSIEAARRGCRVVAIDASDTAVGRIQDVARRDSLSIQALAADLTGFRIDQDFDAIVCIGLLMFMSRSDAHNLLGEIQSRVVPGGLAIINVLIEGTTYLEMFGPDPYYLFGRSELQERFGGWEIIESRQDYFEAPGPTTKAFVTLIARKPA
jgi:tellurite methyltransferase